MDSSTDTTLQQKSCFGEGCQEYTRTLQDMPLEILDMILMKAALSLARSSKKSDPCPAVDLIQESLERFMTVWSEWYSRLNTRWFKIMFRRLSGRSNPSVWKKFSLDQKRRVVAGFTKLRNRIYVLCSEPSSIYVYEDHGDCRLINVISLAETIPIVCGIHSNPVADCLYVLETANEYYHLLKTVWKMDADGNHVTKWLEDDEDDVLFSVGEEGNVMIMRQPRYPTRVRKHRIMQDDQIEIYRPDATLINRFSLPCHVFTNCVQSLSELSNTHKTIANAIHTPQGYFFILHQYSKSSSCTDITYATTLMYGNKNGHTMRTLFSALLILGFDEGDGLISTNEMTKYFFHYPSFISLDEKRNRLFATNYRQNIIFVFDSVSLKWIETIRLHDEPSEETSLDSHEGMIFPTYFVSEERRAFPIYLDTEKRQLLVRNYKTNHVDVYNVL